MPTVGQLVVVCIVAASCALVVSLCLIAIGLGQHVAVAAAISAATSSTVAMTSMRRTARSA